MASKYTVEQILLAHALFKEGATQREIAEKVGILPGSVGMFRKQLDEYLAGKELKETTSPSWAEAVTRIREEEEKQTAILPSVRALPVYEETGVAVEASVDTTPWEMDAEKARTVIYSTRNYDQFKTVIGNRPVTTFNVNSVIKAVGRENLLANFPAFVSRDGYLLDGQHRLEACKVNKLEFFFTVSEKSLQEHIVAELNSSHHNWTIPNYVNYFAKRGNKQYTYLWELMTGYRLTPNVLLELITNSGTTSKSGLKNGGLKLFETDEDKKIIEAFIEGYMLLKGDISGIVWGHSKFVRALRRMFTMVTPLEIQTELVRNTSEFTYRRTTSEYLREFEDFFNYHKSEKNYVRFF